MRVLVLIIFPIFIFSQNFEFNEIFERAVFNKLSCDTLINYCLQEKTEKEKAYLAAGFVLKAKHVNSPFSKWSFFKKGVNKLDHVINKNPNFVEFRWLRYCLQNNVPNFLNYNKNLSEDKIFIEKNGTNQQKRILSETLLNE